MEDRDQAASSEPEVMRQAPTVVGPSGPVLSGLGSSEAILALQRQAGNRATMRALQRAEMIQRSQPRPEQTVARCAGGVCHCGGGCGKPQATNDDAELEDERKQPSRAVARMASVPAWTRQSEEAHPTSYAGASSPPHPQKPAAPQSLGFDRGGERTALAPAVQAMRDVAPSSLTGPAREGSDRTKRAAGIRLFARVSPSSRVLARQHDEAYLNIGSRQALILPKDIPCAPRVAGLSDDPSGSGGALPDELGLPDPDSEVSDTRLAGDNTETPAGSDSGGVAAVSNTSNGGVLLTVRRGTSPVLAREPIPLSDPPPPPSPSPAPAVPTGIDPCDLGSVPASSFSQYERDIRDGKQQIGGVVLDPVTNEIIGYYHQLGRGVWKIVDREGNHTDGGEPGIESPAIDPIDFVPSPAEVVKGISVIGKVGLKVLGKFAFKEGAVGGNKALLKVSAGCVPKLRKVSAALFARGKEAAGKAGAVAAKESAKLLGKIPYGFSDLAKAAIKHRKANKIFTGNVAVFECVTGKATKLVPMESKQFVGHSEQLIRKKLLAEGVDPNSVTRIYSELEPCTILFGGGCKAMIDRTFKNALVTWSFDYGATKESRTAGVEALKTAIEKIK